MAVIAVLVLLILTRRAFQRKPIAPVPHDLRQRVLGAKGLWYAVLLILTLSGSANAAEPVAPIRLSNGRILNPFAVEPGKPLEPVTNPHVEQPHRAMLIPTRVLRSPSVRGNQC